MADKIESPSTEPSGKDHIIKTIEDLQKPIEELIQIKVNLLADWARNCNNEKLADDIKEKGLPYQIICGAEMFPIVSKSLITYVTDSITENTLVKPREVIFFWKDPIVWKPLDSVIEEPDFMKMHKEIVYDQIGKQPFIHEKRMFNVMEPQPGLRRIQIKRTKGFKLPDNTICVNRGTKWGNPYKVVPQYGVFSIVFKNQHMEGGITTKEEASQIVVDCFISYVDRLIKGKALDISELRGKNLACFCPIFNENNEQYPCHADYLLKIANV